MITIPVLLTEEHLDKAIEAKKRGKKIDPLAMSLKELFTFNFKVGMKYVTIGNTGEVGAYELPEKVSDLLYHFLAGNYDEIRASLPVSFNLITAEQAKSEKNLTFEEVLIEGSKTKHYIALARKSGMTVGEIRWNGPLQQYCFYPETRKALTQGYMVEINRKIRKLTLDQELIDILPTV